MKQSLILFAAVFCISTGYCAELRTETVADIPIKSVSIDPVVPVPDEFYTDDSDTLRSYAAYGAAGIVGALTSTDDEELADVIHKHQIKLNQIVLVKFTDALKKSQLYKKINKNHSDATLDLEVIQYGLASPVYPIDLQPVLEVRAKLITNDDLLVWEKKARIESVGANPTKRTTEDFLKNPELIKTVFSQAAEMVAAELVADLKSESEKKATFRAPRPVSDSSSPKFQN